MNDEFAESTASWLWYEANTLSNMTFFTLAYSYRFEGSANIPATGPVLLIANHQSYLDPPAVGLASRRHLVYLARKSLFRNKYFNWLIRSFGAVPIDQQGIGKEGLKTILDQLEHGKAILVFPEGTRTRDGKLRELAPGIHLLIKKSKAPIVPVGISGAFDAWPIQRKYPVLAPLFLPARPGAIAVSIGKPLSGEAYANIPREQALLSLQTEMQKIFEQAERLRRKDR